MNLPEAASALVNTAVVHALGPDWLDPEYILTSFGDIAFWVVVGIIFAECGLLIGFFLPGDSLLFVTGLFIASGAISMNIYLACLILFVAAVVGNVTGYWIGYKAGPSLFSKPDSRLFKQEYVEHTHHFFNKYGARAIIMARFVPDRAHLHHRDGRHRPHGLPQVTSSSAPSAASSGPWA